VLVRAAVGIAAGIIVGVAAFYFGSSSINYFVSMIQATHVQGNVQGLRAYAHGDAKDATAVFIPAKTVLGAANTIAFATTGSNGVATLPTGATEFDTLSEVGASPTFNAYSYTAGSGLTVLRYLYRRPTDGAAMCTGNVVCTAAALTTVNTYPMITNFNCAYMTEPNLTTIDPLASAFSALHPADLMDVTVLTGFSTDVISGNRMVICNMTSSGGPMSIPEQLQLAAGNPLSTATVPVSYSPPPIGAIGLAVNPNPMVLGYLGADGLPATGTATAAASNYHHNFTLNGTTVGSGGASSAACSGIATFGLTTETQDPSGAANSPPSSYPGTWMQFTVTPLAVGSCTETVQTLTGLQPPDNVVQTGSVNVTVRGALTVNPATMSFSVPSGSQNVTVSEPGYAGAFTISSNTCATYASSSGPGSGPSVTDSVTASNPTSGLAGGVCVITYSDNVGDTGTLTVTILSGAMDTWPQSVQYAENGQSLSDLVGPHAFDFIAFLNSALGGGSARAAGCSARAFSDSNFQTVDANDNTYAAYGAATDGNGCYNGSIIVSEAGGDTATFTAQDFCGSVLPTGWSPSNVGVTAALGMASGASTEPTCDVNFSNGYTHASNYGFGHGVVAAEVDGCSTSGGTIGVGETCTIENGTPQYLCYGVGDSPGYTGGWPQDDYVASFSSTSIVTSGPYGTITNSMDFGGAPTITNTVTFTRTAPGAVTIYITDTWASGQHIQIHLTGGDTTTTCTPTNQGVTGPTAETYT
jgi:hypothetical protein